MEKEQEENIRHQLDNDFATLRDLLFTDPSLTGSNTIALGKSREREGKATELDADILSSVPEAQDADYDQHVRELAFDKRSKPKDRTKTEEELALEEKEALEKAEQQRRKRMLGLEDSGSEDGGTSRKKRQHGADDLDDDFFDDEGNEWNGLGVGLGTSTGKVSEKGSDQETEDQSDEEDGESGGESEEDHEQYDLYDEEEDGSQSEGGEQEKLTTKPRLGVSSSATKELPYTFPAPEDHEEFLEIIDGVEDEDVPVIVKRIRTLYHTSLAPDNKLKLQVRCNFMYLIVGLTRDTDTGKYPHRSHPLRYRPSNTTASPR